MRVRIGKQNVALTKPLGKPGGQGAVYAHPHDPRRAVKVYDAAFRTTEQTEKNNYQINNPIAVKPGDHHIARLHEPVHDESTGEVIGVVIDRVVDAIDLSRLVFDPRVPQEFKLRVALNFTRVVADIHAAGHARGDIHLRNELVTRWAEVTSIDIDSLQINTGTTSYRCGAAVSEFQPPEFQGVDYDAVDFTEAQDRWSAAVVLFHLLVEGCHPLDGLYKGPGHRPSPEERIVHSGFFAFGRNRRPDVLPKPAMKKAYKCLPGDIRDLFERTFDLGHSSDVDARPAMAEWATVLKRHAPTTTALSPSLWRELEHPGGATAPPPVAPKRKHRIGRLPGRRTQIAATAAAACLMVGGVGWYGGLFQAPAHTQPAANYASFAAGLPRLPVRTNVRAAAPPDEESPAPDIRLNQLSATPPGKVPALWSAIRQKGIE